MSFALIEIAQHEATRWVAHVEIGGLVARRKQLNGATFDEMIELVRQAYAEMMPKPVAPVQVIGPRVTYGSYEDALASAKPVMNFAPPADGQYVKEISSEEVTHRTPIVPPDADDLGNPPPRRRGRPPKVRDPAVDE
jgi:hypothetical protein